MINEKNDAKLYSIRTSDCCEYHLAPLLLMMVELHLETSIFHRNTLGWISYLY